MLEQSTASTCYLLYLRLLLTLLAKKITRRTRASRGKTRSLFRNDIISMSQILDYKT